MAFLAAMGGILVAEHVPLSWAWWMALSLATVAGFLFWQLPKIVAALFLTFLSTSHLHHLGVREQDWLEQRLRRADSPLNVSFQGTHQERNFARSDSLLLHSVEIDGNTYRAPLLVHLAPGSPEMPLGRFQGFGQLRPSEPQRNPGEETSPPKLYLTSHHATSTIPPSILQRARTLANRCRTWMEGALTKGIEDRPLPSGILPAMVLGAKEEASKEAREAFRKSGALHIFAVSGLHVGIFASVLWFALRNLLRVPRMATTLVVAVAVLFYAFLTGLRPSAVRAALMLIVVLGGHLLDRQPRLLNSLGLAGIIILLVEPKQLFDIGFQLSFSVLWSIALFTRPFSERISAAFAPDPFLPRSLYQSHHQRALWFGRQGGSLAGVSLAAWIGSAFWLAYYFGMVTPIAILSNCFLVPLAWLVMSGAVTSLCLHGLSLGFLGAGVNQLNAILVSVLYTTATFFSSVPGGHHEFRPWQDHRKSFTTVEDTLTLFDYQTSCAPLLFHHASGKKAWLIDPGDSSSYAKTLRLWQRRHQIPVWETLILTHADDAHTDSAPWILKEQGTKAWISSGRSSRSSTWKRIHRGDFQETFLLGSTGFARSPPADRPLRWEILYPPAELPDQALADDESLVILIDWDGWKFLHLSDGGFLTERWLLQQHPRLRCDVLIKSQHARDASATEAFLLHVQPQLLYVTESSFPVAERIPSELQSLCAQRGMPLLRPSE
ncbi:MAG: ComEC/Rec2 family competence protein, partial [Verrucomicrobiota bacterium]